MYSMGVLDMMNAAIREAMNLSRSIRNTDVQRNGVTQNLHAIRSIYD